jgi:hypothetical protein
MLHRLCGAALLSAVLAACAIHPQTEDFSREYLPDIVYKIRCETRDAIRSTLPHDASSPLFYLNGSGMTFDFEFVLTENDDATSNGSVQIPISLGSFTIGWDSGLKKQRQTTLNVTVSDAFATLLTLQGCDAPSRPNYKYPITGSIGVEDSMKNFAKLAKQNTGLFTEFSDELKFTTDLKASIKPSVKLTPKVGRQITADAAVTLQRIDVHKVKLSYSPPALIQLSDDERRKKKATIVMLIDPKGKPVDPRAIGSGGTVPFIQPEAKSAPPGGADVPAKKKARTLTPAPSASPSTKEIEQRSYERFLENESRRTNQQILDLLRNR